MNVIFLKNAGHYEAGQIVDFPEDYANSICTAREVNDGTKLVVHQIAMPLEEYEARKALPLDKGGMTQGELAAMGLKNVVPTPPEFLELPKGPTPKKKKASKNETKDEETSEEESA